MKDMTREGISMERHMEEGTLPEYLRRLRRCRGYRQAYVASRLNITRQTYSHYETGRIRPPAGALYGIAELYGIPAEELLHAAAGAWKGGCREKEEGFTDAPAGTGPEGRLLYYFRSLDERDKREILSIMEMKMENRRKERGEGCRA